MLSAQQAETQRRDFLLMLERAERDGEREGFASIEAVEAELDAVIERAFRRRE